MRGHHLEAWLTMLEEKPHSRRACSLSSATRWPGSTSKPFREVRRSAPQRASSRFPPRAWSTPYSLRADMGASPRIGPPTFVSIATWSATLPRRTSSC